MSRKSSRISFSLISSRTLRRTCRGLALASILMIVGIVLVLSLSLASVSIFQLNIALAMVDDAKARMSAESQVNRVLFKLKESETYGLNGEKETWTDPYMGTTCSVTFNDNDEAYSTYNLTGTTDIPGWRNKNVPSSSIRIVTTGYAGKSIKRMDVIVKRGSFPYALGTTAKIQSLNSPLWVEGVMSTSSLLAGVKDRPGSVHSNFSGGTAIEAPQNSYLTGILSACGDISLQMPSKVLGGIRPQSGEVELPVIDVATFDPKDIKGTITMTSGTYNGLTLNSVHRAAGSIAVAGDLQLENAVLYSESDITISGKVIGNGAILSRGKVTIGGSSNLSASNKVAIVADGDVTIAGQGSYLQGMVYTHGNFYGENFTLLGNLIAQSSEQDKGQAILKNVKLIFNEEAGNISIKSSVATATPAPAPAPPTSLSGRVDATHFKAVHAASENFNIRYNTQDAAGLKKALQDAAGNFNATTAAEIDKYGSLSFYLTCYGGGGSETPHYLTGSMTDLWNKISANGANSYMIGINNSIGSSIPNKYDLTGCLSGLFNSIIDKIDKSGAGNPAPTPSASPGEGEPTMVTTDLTLNKYITNVLPTRVTFQGEVP